MWATKLEVLLVQTKEQTEKHFAKSNKLLKIVLVDQSESGTEEEKESMKIFKLLSRMIQLQFSQFVMWTAHKSTSASAWRGDLCDKSLVQKLQIEPLLSLAMIAKAVLVLERATLLLSLMQPGGGGDPVLDFVAQPWRGNKTHSQIF